MDVDIIQPKVERAKELLRTAKHAAMATVNQDGSPHNTPYFFMHSPDLKYLYWGSSPESEHSKNVARTGQIFVVLYDAFEGGGLFIQANEAHAAKGEELHRALVIHNELRAKAGRNSLPPEYYQGDGPQRMYKATVQKFWVNASKRGKDGHVIRDYRYEITAEQLL